MTQTNKENEAFLKLVDEHGLLHPVKCYSEDEEHALQRLEAFAKAYQTISQNEHQESVTNLWEAFGKWSAYLASNGEQANLAPPSWLIDAVSSATSPPKQIPDEWKPSEKEILKYASEEELFLFADESDLLEIANGILELVQIKINTAPATSLTSETNTEVGE